MAEDSCIATHEEHESVYESMCESIKTAKLIVESPKFTFCENCVEKLVINVRNLIINHAKYLKKVSAKEGCVLTNIRSEDDWLLENMMPKSLNNKESSGQVEWGITNLNAVIDEGNIRERLTLIYNTRETCLVWWDIIHLYKTDKQEWESWFGCILDSILFEKRIASMERNLGIPIDIALKACASEACSLVDTKCFQRKALFSLCSYIHFPTSGQVLTSKICKEADCRTRRKDEQSAEIRTKIEDVRPLLSAREKNFMNLTETDIYTTWRGGASYFEPPADNFYSHVYKSLGKKIINGPSGTTDIILNIVDMFDFSNNEKIGILLCLIVWMVIPMDHNVFEILSVANIHSFINYDITEKEHEFVKDLLKRVNCN